MLPGLRVALASIALVAAAGRAPLQCAREPDPRRRTVEDPSEVIFELAERFEAQGDRDARVATLRYLIERYPSSRFAEMARQDLEALGERPPEAKPAEAP